MASLWIHNATIRLVCTLHSVQAQFNPLKHETHMNTIHKLCSHFEVNKARLHQIDKSVNYVQRNNRYLF